jgi:phosphoglycerate dehydrogenase-like enzyme
VPRQLLEKGVIVTNWGTSISHTIAEQAMLLTLGALRNVSLWKSFMGMPADRAMTLRTKSLRGKRIGVHGFGGIARELVQMLRGFKVEIAAYSSGVPKEVFEDYAVRCCESLEELFSTSDVVIECEALTSRTTGSVTESILRLLPEDAVFINIARGALVDESALQKMVSEGRIRVALDVFREEPLPSDSPWFQMPSAFLSPHIAGPTSDEFVSCGRFAIENLHQYLIGGRLEGVMTLETYDRVNS